MARVKRVALVFCQGRPAGQSGDGPDCRQLLESRAADFDGCAQGCLGGGSCVAACRLNAIRIGSRGSAVVNREKCVGCGLCVKACPQGLIQLIPAETAIMPRCATRLPGPQVRKACAAGCVSCRICEKNCPADAIAIRDGHAVIDGAKCISCGMCAVKCPRGVIVDADGVLTALVD